MSELAKVAENDQTSAADKAKIMSAMVGSVANDSSWLIRRAAISEIHNLLVPQQQNPLAQASSVKFDDATTQVLQKAAKDEKSLSAGN